MLSPELKPEFEVYFDDLSEAEQSYYSAALFFTYTSLARHNPFRFPFRDIIIDNPYGEVEDYTSDPVVDQVALEKRQNAYRDNVRYASKLPIERRKELVATARHEVAVAFGDSQEVIDLVAEIYPDAQLIK